MDKMKINDQMILMRKSMKAAKIYSIRKILKQIKLLQKKTNKEKNEKIQRKIDRLRKEVDITRKLDVDKVSNVALKEEKEWNKILIQKDTSIEERTLARLISHKKVQEKIAQFRSENPELQTLLPSVLKKWEKRSLLKVKTVNAGKNDISKVNRECDSENDTDLENSENTNERNELEKEKLNSMSDSKNKRSFPKKEKLKKIPNVSVSETDEDQVDDTIGETIKNIPAKRLCKEMREIPNKVEGSMQILQIDLDKLNKDDDIFINSVVQDNISKLGLTKQKLSDSFFSNGNDSDEDNSDNNNDDNSEHSVSENEHPIHSKMKTQFVSSLSNNRRKFPSKVKPKSFSKQLNNKRTTRKSEKGKENSRENNLSSFKSNKRGEDLNQESNLHPSWEAKKKQKTKILPFQGKKIKFDVDD
ncbi:serum response factor-binding protein 1-like [Centruroides vittatus]|uniref:serum response factor-binding protein 1-like n=1 Tax=Centruroides vittatus TaxID=120091 RepID=UPI003510618E